MATSGNGAGRTTGPFAYRLYRPIRIVLAVESHVNAHPKTFATASPSCQPGKKNANTETATFWRCPVHWPFAKPLPGSAERPHDHSRRDREER